MAAEETLTTCNMDLLSMETLVETAGFSSGENLGILQSCIDPSIFSIFEDIPTAETKGLDEESEATLLTALTEILDNVDDENLSPFDTLPDSDLLSSRKGREHSPLRGILCLSRSPQENDPFCSTRPISAGKNLFRLQADSVQRSDGEEEEDGSFTLSQESRGSAHDCDLLGWEGLTLPLPVTFEQEDETGLSVSLGDLVRHMHPYCIPISVEDEKGEQMLPEGGILLEVVDQGENGEPILAIPNISLCVSEELEELPEEREQKVSDEAEEELSDSSEHIVVDDEDDLPVMKNCEVAARAATVLCSEVKDEVASTRQKEDNIKKPSRRKRKKKCKDDPQPTPVEGRVLRSRTVSKPAQESQKKMEKRSSKEQKKQKVPKVPLTSTKPSILKEEETKQCKTKTEDTTTPEPKEEASAFPSPKQETVQSSPPEKSPSTGSDSGVSSQQPRGATEQPVTVSLEVGSSSATPSDPPLLVSSDPPIAAVTPEITPPVSAAPPAPEPKPKSLSLQEYRRLRQLKKPTPMEKQDHSSTKWPTLPEPPKELPPIPCLPYPKDTRHPCPKAANKEVEEIKPAWQPRGPGAPPTPEALLVPPAYMISSSNKVSSAALVPKPPQTPDPSKLPLKPSPPPPNSENTLNMRPPTAAQPKVLCVPQSSVPLNPADQLTSSVDGNCSAVSGGKGVVYIQPNLPKSVAHTKTPTTDVTKPTAASGSVPQKSTDVSQKLPEVTPSTSFSSPIPSDGKSSKPTTSIVKPSPAAASLLDSCSPKPKPAVLETKAKTTAQKAKNATQELIEAFTSEIGIEAADLTSLLEQFEETQVKEECVPEVSGRAAAVGNSRAELVPEKSVVERLKANDLSTSAALTPPATPPHQMWKPLSTVALLGKSKAAEVSKLNPSKVIQIEAQPLPLGRSRSKPTSAAATVAPELACLDHDYCLPSKDASGEPGKRWNVKQQSLITIKPIKQHSPTPPAAVVPSLQLATNPKTQDFPQTDRSEKKYDEPKECSVLETPDASPTRQESESYFKVRSHRGRPLERSYRGYAASRSPSPSCSPRERRGRPSRKRRSHRSPSPSSSCSDSCSSRSRSRSFSPPKKRYRSRNLDSSSSSSSRSSSRSSPSLSRSPPRRRRYSYSSSRSGSWSRSRSRSQSPQSQWSGSRRFYSPTHRPKDHYDTMKSTEDSKRRKEKAIEERRVVYVGRIRGSMTQRELKERFSLFGEVEECTLHFRDHGDNYGFVTYYDTKNAFTAIENGSKLRKPDELPFDLCFGGRRQFCQSTYSDLDSSRDYDSLKGKGKFHALDFDTLLKQAQQNLKR
uniref:Peroxisome proliferator-activated receptor gamma, coactivator-related 1 n=2 Tax=Iconisemion striatum TaxID=60296 RepID=A0A1A7WJP0_9TELE